MSSPDRAEDTTEARGEYGRPTGREPFAYPATPEAGQAVEDLLEEVGSQTDPMPFVTVEGLEGRTAIVTGGSSGIGRAVALAFARAGVNVAFNYLDDSRDAREAADQTAADIEAFGTNAFHRPVDCAESDAVQEFVSDTVDRLGGLHILVNNAGVARSAPLWEMSGTEWDRVLATNLTGAFHFLRYVAPIFRSQEYGKVVNVSSINALKSERGLAAFSSSKAGVLALTRSAALELGPANVNVNAVAPGYIRTSRLTQQVSAETLDRVRAESALGRLGDPQDVAGTIVFLCSEAARHVTGAVIPVDGGYHL